MTPDTVEPTLPADSTRQGAGGNVLIIGGGLAGLAAAVDLVDQGLSVTLVEARAKLGGRASSFVDPATGEWVDQCQHVSMGCCTNLASFYRRLGVDDSMDQYDELLFVDERGRQSRIGASPLPVPFHLAPSFVAARFLTWMDKLRIGWGMFRLIAPLARDEQRSARDWLLAHGQTPRTIDRFWGVVLVSALNESLDRIDMRYARQVFVDGFLSNRRSFFLEIPRVPLGSLYGERMHDWLRKAGVRLELGMPAKQLIFEDGRVQGGRFSNDEELRADATVIAVPFHRVGDLMTPELIDRDPSLGRLEKMESSPITSVHLWYDRPVMSSPHLVIVGRTVQWLFRRSGDTGGYVQAVISASRDLLPLGSTTIRDRVIEEVAEILPMAREARLEQARVVTDRRATYSVVPGIDAYRLPQRTKIPGLYLAGDFTQTGWPATMEGAVRSGRLAAQNILNDSGRSTRPMEDLPPVGRLVRWLRGQGEST